MKIDYEKEKVCEVMRVALKVRVCEVMRVDGGALKRSIEDSDYPAKRSRRVNPDEIDYEKEKVCEVMRVADRYHAIVSKCFVAGKFTLNHEYIVSLMRHIVTATKELPQEDIAELLALQMDLCNYI